jgi:hypothetical protein
MMAELLRPAYATTHVTGLTGTIILFVLRTRQMELINPDPTLVVF